MLETIPENIHMPFYYSSELKENVNLKCTGALSHDCLNALKHVLLNEILFCFIDTYYNIVKYKQPPMHYRVFILSTTKQEKITTILKGVRK